MDCGQQKNCCPHFKDNIMQTVNKSGKPRLDIWKPGDFREQAKKPTLSKTLQLPGGNSAPDGPGGGQSLLWTDRCRPSAT